MNRAVRFQDAAVRLDARRACLRTGEVVRLKDAVVEKLDDAGVASTRILEGVEIRVAPECSVGTDVDVDLAAAHVLSPAVGAGGTQNAAGCDVDRHVSLRRMVAEPQVTGTQFAADDVQHRLRRHVLIVDRVSHRDVLRPRVAAGDGDGGGKPTWRGCGVAVGTPDRQEVAEVVVPAANLQMRRRLRIRRRSAVPAHDELVVAEIVGHRVRRVDHDASVHDDKAGDANRRAVAVGADVRYLVDAAQGAAVEGIPASLDRGGRGDGHRAGAGLDEAAVHRREASGEREVVVEVQDGRVLLRARRHQDRHVAVG